VTNGIPLRCPLFLLVYTANCVQTLKAIQCRFIHQAIEAYARESAIELSPLSKKRASKRARILGCIHLCIFCCFVGFFLSVQKKSHHKHSQPFPFLSRCNHTLCHVTEGIQTVVSSAANEKNRRTHVSRRK